MGATGWPREYCSRLSGEDEELENLSLEPSRRGDTELRPPASSHPCELRTTMRQAHPLIPSVCVSLVSRRAPLYLDSDLSTGAFLEVVGAVVAARGYGSTQEAGTRYSIGCGGDGKRLRCRGVSPGLASIDQSMKLEERGERAASRQH